MQELKFMSFNRSSSLSRSPSRPGQNESLLHANRSSAAHLDQFTEISEDPKGRLIRSLRIQLELDPAELATQACISVAQLYEIEQGLSTRFYSSSLREQAAKRVAKLLNADWDKLEETAIALKSTNKVVQLQWPLSNKPSPMARQQELNALSDSHTSPSAALKQPIALVLSTPCQNQVNQVIPQSQETPVIGHQQPLHVPMKHARSPYFWRSLMLLLSGLLGYGIALWSPYELVWPSQLIWPSSLVWPLEFAWPEKISWPFSF